MASISPQGGILPGLRLDSEAGCGQTGSAVRAFMLGPNPGAGSVTHSSVNKAPKTK